MTIPSSNNVVSFPAFHQRGNPDEKSARERVVDDMMPVMNRIDLALQDMHPGSADAQPLRELKSGMLGLLGFNERSQVQGYLLTALVISDHHNPLNARHEVLPLLSRAIKCAEQAITTDAKDHRQNEIPVLWLGMMELLHSFDTDPGYSLLRTAIDRGLQIEPLAAPARVLAAELAGISMPTVKARLPFTPPARTPPNLRLV